MTTPQENQPGEAAQDLVGPEPQAGGASSETAALIASITEYLSLGGLFNPEMMDHNAVRDLLINCRTQLAAERAKRLALEKDRCEVCNAELTEYGDISGEGLSDCLQCRMAEDIKRLRAELLALRGGEGRKVSAKAMAWLKTMAAEGPTYFHAQPLAAELLCVLSEEGGRQKEGHGDAAGRPVDGASDLNPQNESDL